MALAGWWGDKFNRMFQNALEVGKRVRTETDIGKKPVSVAFAGVKLAERIFGSLKGHSALILGAGATGEQVMDTLIAPLEGGALVEIFPPPARRKADSSADFVTSRTRTVGAGKLPALRKRSAGAVQRDDSGRPGFESDVAEAGSFHQIR